MNHNQNPTLKSKIGVLIPQRVPTDTPNPATDALALVQLSCAPVSKLRPVPTLTAPPSA